MDLGIQGPMELFRSIGVTEILLKIRIEQSGVGVKCNSIRFLLSNRRSFVIFTSPVSEKMAVGIVSD
jgi:hypothetical protein